MHTVNDLLDNPGVRQATGPFAQALKRSLVFEGGWSNDPDDRGGKTNYGVTENTWRLFWYPQAPPYDIAAISLEDAIQVYRKLYWEAPQITALENKVQQPILNELLDAAINHGAPRAIMFLQAAYNFLRDSGLPELLVDGVLGPTTAAAIIKFVARQEWAQALLAGMRGERYNFYAGIIRRNPSQAKFKRGWLRRLVDWIL